jgi:O-antigen/teichoic acid export membrane protein
MTSGPRPLSAGASLFAILRILSLAGNALVSVLIARLLGARASGTFGVAAGLLSLLVAFGSLGIDTGVTWMVSSRRWEGRSAFATSQVAAGLLGLVAGGIGLAVYASASEGLLSGITPKMAIIVAAAVPFALSGVFASQVALAMDHFEIAAGVLAVQAGVLVTGVAVFASTWGVQGAVFGTLAGSVAGAAAGWLWVRRLKLRTERDRAPERIDWPRLWKSIRFGITAYLTSVLAILTLRFDLFILNASAPAAQVGYYTVAVAATNLIWLLPASLGTVLMPRTAALSTGTATARTRDATETKSLRHTTFVLGATVLVALAVLLFLLEPIWGTQFSRSLQPSLLLIPGAVAVGYASVMSSALIGRARPRFLLISGSVTTITAIALYLVLVPAYHANGAAVASSVAYILNCVLTAYFLRRVSGLPVVPRLVPGREEIMDYRRVAKRIRRRLIGAPKTA